LYKIELFWLISYKKYSNWAKKLPNINNHTLNIMTFLAIFLACFRFWTHITRLISLKIKHEKLIFNWDFLIINFLFIWILRIDYCAWYSIIASSDPKKSKQRPSCGTIFKINFLCNCDIISVVSDPLFGIKAITIRENAGNSIYFIKYIN